MTQCRLADELHLSWTDTEKMSYIDRMYCIKYLELKGQALQKMFDESKGN